MDINDLKLFARAAELGNITHASAELGYTQSAASHALRRLEQNLGTQLLQRLHMGVCLTENGKELLPYVSTMLAAQEQLLQKAADLSGSVSGVVSVGCISSVAIRCANQQRCRWRVCGRNWSSSPPRASTTMWEIFSAVPDVP